MVKHSQHEFTIDFLRLEFDESNNAASGVLVERINVSPLFITQLIDALQSNWTVYANKALPKEIQDDDPPI